MISLSFNLGVILGSFVLFILFYILLVFSKGLFFTSKIIETADETEISKDIKFPFFWFFLSIFIISALDFSIRVFASLPSIPINVFWLQGLLALGTIAAGLLIIPLWLKKPKIYPILGIVFLIISLPLAVFWIRTNVLEGFAPFIPNFLLVAVTQVFLMVSGLVYCFFEFLAFFNKNSQLNDIQKAFHIGLFKLFVIFSLSHLLTIAFPSTHFNYAYIAESLIGVPALFLIFTLLDTTFVSLNYYKNPSLYLRERIIFRMIISLALLIVFSLELVNYATLYIIKSEMITSKKIAYKNIIAQVQDGLHKHLVEKQSNLAFFITDSGDLSSIYQLGMSLFKDIAKVPGLQSVVVINSSAQPMMEISDNKLNFSYTPDNPSQFQAALAFTRNKGVSYYINPQTHLLELMFATYDNYDGTINASLFKNIKGLTDSDIQDLLGDFKRSGFVNDKGILVKTADALERELAFPLEKRLEKFRPAILSIIRPIKTYFLAFYNDPELFTLLKSYAFERNGEILLLSADYHQIYSTYEQHSLKEEMQKSVYLEVYTTDPTTGLVISVRQPENDALAGLQSAQYNSFFFTTLAIVLFLFIAFLFLRIIEKPIRTLQQGAKVIGSGNLDFEIVIKEKNEFYELALAFNHMIQDLRRLQKDQLKKEQLLSITQMSVGLNHEINNPTASILMGAQLIEKIVEKMQSEVPEELHPKMQMILTTAHQINEESKRISKILKDIQNIHEPVIEDYVDGTKMLRVKFD